MSEGDVKRSKSQGALTPTEVDDVLTLMDDKLQKDPTKKLSPKEAQALEQKVDKSIVSHIDRAR